MMSEQLDAFGNKVCSVCGTWTRQYVYWGGSHDVRVCVHRCLDNFLKIADLIQKAKAHDDE